MGSTSGWARAISGIKVPNRVSQNGNPKPMPTFLELLESKITLSAVSAVLGALFWNYVAWSRGRVRVLDYTVTHDRVGVSAADTVLGDIAVTWGGTPVANLFLTTVTLENNTSSNLTDLMFKTWTGNDTFLLNERREVMGSTFHPNYTPEYAASLATPTGEAPTSEQNQIYWHNREYHLPVFNRNQRAIFRYLTTAPQNTDGPGVWADMQHRGVRVEFRPVGPRVHGVPLNYAMGAGLAAAVLTLAVAVGSGVPTWVAAAACLLVGLVAQSVGAGLYRVGRFLYRVVFH